MEGLYERVDERTVVLAVYVQPGASATRVVGRHGAEVKVRVAAPPEQGRATEAALEALAVALGVRRSDVELVAGAGSRHKRVRVSGLGADVFADRLGALLTD